ncbi:MAG: putative acetyltransferase [Frankiales bacterium]|nr:putative acetyltransferase [Frankiales bacterium]
MSEGNEQRWTDRLHLRRPAAADIEALVGPDQAAACARDWASDGLGYWAVERNGQLIGVCGLRFLTFHLRDTWDLHATFVQHAWGRGYALEVVEEALVVAKEQSANLPVVARTRPDDAHGFGLAERAGLIRRKDLDRDDLQVHCSHW